MADQTLPDGYELDFQYFIPIEKLEILRKDNILLMQLLT